MSEEVECILDMVLRWSERIYEEKLILVFFCVDSFERKFNSTTGGT